MRNSTRTWPRYLALAALCLAGCLALWPARAGVVIGGTRQIYPAQNREITIQLTNEDKKLPRLVQVWLDSGDEKITPEQSDVPFTITPPVFRMEAGKSQSLRLVYTREPLPADRESVFWLNVLEVPPKVDGEESQLRFSFRIRTKVFFRPQGLPGAASDAVSQLRWSLLKTAQGSMLEVQNPSPYHVSFQEVALALGNGPDARLNKSDQYEMVAPGGSRRYLLKDIVGALPTGAHVQFSTINDYGAFVPEQAPLQPAVP
ncbi:MAG: pili assembly chaperone [Collimonas fungivorans]|uniref:fimbrial biogenesis chaperone n=1 Tax=Collimonas fungivorans TaxID=158899 RepID=UPI0026EAD79C|nr:fimbria/pilus periplasmic chaperone [Collimonas fungivorans]MDB5768849.1 pili assembly chaperone [Collimonas fungivorans]